MSRQRQSNRIESANNKAPDSDSGFGGGGGGGGGGIAAEVFRPGSERNIFAPAIAAIDAAVG